MASSKERKRGKRRSDRHTQRRENSKGGGDWDAIRLPEGLEAFKPEDGQTYSIDLIPTIAGKLNKNCHEGDEYFELTYPVYNGLGIDEKKYIAIGDLMGVRDPVAEHFAHLRKHGNDWDEMKPFSPTKRQLMLFFVHEQADKGLQFYEGSVNTFGKQLDEEIADAGEEVWVDNLDDPDGGATVRVRFKAEDIGMKNKWLKASKVDLREREGGFTADGNKKLAKEILEQAAGICLDDCLKLTTYETLKKALDGEPMTTTEGEATETTELDTPTGRRTRKKAEPKAEAPPEEPKAEPKPKRKAPTAESLGITKGMDVEHDDHGTCQVIRIAKGGLTINIMDGEDNVHKGVDPTDVEPVVEGKAEGPDTTAPEPATPAPAKTGPPSDASDTAESASKSTSPSDDGWDDDWED